jgi:hypothetical protein
MARDTVKAATPWGAATLIEEVRLPQQSGGRRFASLVQLLEDDKGERLVRFAYATDGVARRGPVTLRMRDLERLREGLARHPGLEALLRL